MGRIAGDRDHQLNNAALFSCSTHDTADLPVLNVGLALARPEPIHHQQAVPYREQQATDNVL
ncbi:MAG: hypothetical protein ACK52U_00895 [Synechococcaceae cyanobacterium]|jgi:hypothetical protein